MSDNSCGNSASWGAGSARREWDSSNTGPRCMTISVCVSAKPNVQGDVVAQLADRADWWIHILHRYRDACRWFGFGHGCELECHHVIMSLWSWNVWECDVSTPMASWQDTWALGVCLHAMLTGRWFYWYQTTWSNAVIWCCLILFDMLRREGDMIYTVQHSSTLCYGWTWCAYGDSICGSMIWCFFSMQAIADGWNAHQGRWANSVAKINDFDQQFWQIWKKDVNWMTFWIDLFVFLIDRQRMVNDNLLNFSKQKNMILWMARGVQVASFDAKTSAVSEAQWMKWLKWHENSPQSPIEISRNIMKRTTSPGSDVVGRN